MPRSFLATGCGRLGGGRLVARFGETRLLVGGAVLAAVGLLVAALTPVIAIALAGFVVVGLGLANVFPLAIARAGALGGAGGVALASTVGYTGLLVGPPVIGFLAEWAGLPIALTTISLLACVAAVLALAVHDGPAALAWPALSRIPARVPALRPAQVTWLHRLASGYARDLTILSAGMAGVNGVSRSTTGPTSRVYPGLELLVA